jgi:hypothetical protein
LANTLPRFPDLITLACILQISDINTLFLYQEI